MASVASIDWTKVQSQMTKGSLIAAMRLKSEEFEKTCEYIDNWLKANNPTYSLSTNNERRRAKQFTDQTLRPVYIDILQRIPPGAFADDAPYGFVRWYCERKKVVIKKEDAKKEKTLPSSTSTLPRSRSSTRATRTPAPHHPRPPSDNDTLLLEFSHYSTHGPSSNPVVVSLNSISPNAADEATLTPTTLVKYAEIAFVWKHLGYKGLLPNPDQPPVLIPAKARHRLRPCGTTGSCKNAFDGCCLLPGGFYPLSLILLPKPTADTTENDQFRLYQVAFEATLEAERVKNSLDLVPYQRT
ncbi:MAG: hypothetical protein Q9182_005752 [Xanthomendoza sp. 2 TL-2023]